MTTLTTNDYVLIYVTQKQLHNASSQPKFGNAHCRGLSPQPQPPRP